MIDASEPEPPWLAIARRELGVHEIAGGPNARIGQYLATVGGHAGDNWCAAFVAWCLTQAGVKGRYSPAARDMRHVGRQLEEPRLGCLAILWRGAPTSWMGHVGFVVRETPKTLSLLGGNQSDSVCIKAYPRARLLELRWPV